ncbi:CaiB/BaiF CoA transferase family protein [Phenylobacterium sp.]|uniref:CaiB/BaiF CoA transferase family protein n=1 Tax=Phenylobacterium sp. TaxID=1871053 RepID=UPI0039C925C8
MEVQAVANGPLEGLIVVEAGQLIAGPFCGQLLGDMGATVIKIEPPGKGDPMRAWGRGAPVWWEVIARNKRSVSIDLRKPEGQDLARRLIDGADILIENFRPGTLEGWGLAPGRLHETNPGLIVVRMSGYGQTGPYADRAGFGGIGEAMGGWRNIVGEPDRPPARMGVSIGDTLAATYGCIGALAALRHRDATGQGQVVDSALYEAVLQAMESLVPEYVATGQSRERSGAILPGIAPSNVYPCTDGEFLIGANGEGVFRRLCQAMGQPDLADHPRYCDHASRGRNQTELDELIAGWTRTLSVDALEALMLEHGVPAGRIYKPGDMLADPHFAAREAIVELPDHPRWPGLKMQGVFPKLSLTPGGVRSIAPQSVGEDNQDILGERLGLDEATLSRLAAAGII